MQPAELSLALAPMLCKSINVQTNHQIINFYSVSGNMRVPIRLNSNRMVECRVSPAMTILELKSNLALALQKPQLVRYKYSSCALANNALILFVFSTMEIFCNDVQLQDAYRIGRLELHRHSGRYLVCLYSELPNNEKKDLWKFKFD